MMAVAQILKGVADANAKLDEILRQLAEGQTGTFNTSVTRKCHPKPTYD
jgi:hypothetical protein